MPCDRDIRVLISSYADGETTPAEAARAAAHLAACAECRALVEQWQGHRQLFTWAYTREIPDEVSAADLARRARKEHPMETEGTQEEARTAMRAPLVLRRWLWGGAFAAVLLVALLVQGGLLSRPLRVGQELATGDTARQVKLGRHVALQIGPHTRVRRTERRTLRLEQGWVAVTVQQGDSITVGTPRMTVTDRGTRFRVGIGPKADYVAVSAGAVEVTAGSTLRTVTADQALLVSPAGGMTLLSAPPLPPGQTDDGQPLRSYHPEFYPCTALELARAEGIQRLAGRFPEARFGSGTGYSSPGLQEWALQMTPSAEQREAIRRNLARIAELASGVTADTGEWSVPVALLQTAGFQQQNGIADDTYFVRLVGRRGTLIWQFYGSRGQQVDLPVTFEPLSAEQAMDLSYTPLHAMVWYESRHGSRTTQTFQLGTWPGAADPTLHLSIEGRQKLAVWDSEREFAAQVLQQFAGDKSLKFRETAFSNALYLDPQRKHRMLFAGNENCGRQLCDAYDRAKRGTAGAVTLGVLYSDMPLAQPPAAKGAYLVRFVLPAGGNAPYLQLATPDGRAVAARQGASAGLPDTGPRVSGGAMFAYGTSAQLGVNPARGGMFPVSVGVYGNPDDASSRKTKQGRASANGEWATGWIQIKQP